MNLQKWASLLSTNKENSPSLIKKYEKDLKELKEKMIFIHVFNAKAEYQGNAIYRGNFSGEFYFEIKKDLIVRCPKESISQNWDRSYDLINVIFEDPINNRTKGLNEWKEIMNNGDFLGKFKTKDILLLNIKI